MVSCLEVYNVIFVFLIKVLAAIAALASAAEVSHSEYGELPGNVVSNELLRTNRRIFNSGSGGWGGSSGGSSSYKPGPPPFEQQGFLNLFNAMSNFGLNSNYGPPSSSGSSSGSRPSSQYGPPPPAGGSRPPTQYGPPPPAGGSPSVEYGPPASPPSASRPPSSQYGPPSVSSASVSSGGPLPVVSTRSRGNMGGAPGGYTAPSSAAGPEGGRIFRYVSLFTAPEEPAPTRTKVLRTGPATPDKHVNIIFVKPPSPPAEQPTEVLLAPEPERKTIVYVLMKKPVENPDAVRIRAPAPTNPPKPEVFFIPYKDPNGQAPGVPSGPGGYGNGNEDLVAPGPGPSGGNPGGYA